MQTEHTPSELQALHALHAEHHAAGHDHQPAVRVQTGVRLEEKMLKVLKGLAEYLDISLGDLLEGIVLHAFEGKAPFTPQTMEKIAALKSIYNMQYTATDSHHLVEQAPEA